MNGPACPICATWEDLEETPIPLQVFLDDWCPRLNAARCAAGDIQKRALEAIVWKDPPTYMAWSSLADWFAQAMDATARAALQKAPSEGVERIQLGSGCVVHRVAAWGAGGLRDATPQPPMWKPQTLEECLAPRTRPPESHVLAVLRWRKHLAQLKRHRGAYEAMVWSAPTTTALSWLCVWRGLTDADDHAEYGAARRRARAAGKDLPTWKELQEHEGRLETAAAKRAWARYVAKRAAEKSAPRKKGARHGS